MKEAEIVAIEQRLNAKPNKTCDCIVGLSNCYSCEKLFLPNSFTFKIDIEFRKHARADIQALINEVRINKTGVLVGIF